MSRLAAYVHSVLCGDLGPMPRYDMTFGDADGRWLRRTLRKGDWREADAFLRRVGDWNDFDFFTRLAADWPGRPPWVEAWAAESTEPGLGVLIRGIHSVHWAWEARGSAWVPVDFGEFQRRLELARIDLHNAARARPRDPTPWAWLIRVQRGQQEPLSEAFDCLKQVRKRCDDHWGAHRSMIESTASKWGGSGRIMWEYVDKVTSKALHGSPLHALVPLATYEDVLDLQRSNPGLSDDAYFGRPEVRQRLHMAKVNWQRSPAFKTLRNEAELRNVYAVIFYFAHMYADAHEEFRAIGPYMAMLPWGGDGPKAVKDFFRTRRSAKYRSTWTKMPTGL